MSKFCEKCGNQLNDDEITNLGAVKIRIRSLLAALVLSVEPEDEEAVRVALVLVSADRCALVYQAVYPQRLGDDQIDDAVQRMVDSMDVLGGSTAKDVG